jgi:hypothetical protein
MLHNEIEEVKIEIEQELNEWENITRETETNIQGFNNYINDMPSMMGNSLSETKKEIP